MYVYFYFPLYTKYMPVRYGTKLSTVLLQIVYVPVTNEFRVVIGNGAKKIDNWSHLITYLFYILGLLSKVCM